MGYKKYNKIFQYTKDGRLIKVWNGRKELLTSSFRMKAVYDCINGVNKSGDGFVWTTVSQEVSYTRKTSGKQVSVYNEKGNLIKTFNSVIDCSQYLKCSAKTLSSCLCNKKPYKNITVYFGKEEHVKVLKSLRGIKYVPKFSSEEILNIVGNYQVDNGKYYLYRHIRLDKNEVFYVGIGTKNWNTNLVNIKREIEYSRAYSKTNRTFQWKNIVNLNKDFIIEILLESDNYAFIKKKEVEFITLYGRKDLGKGTLCNMTNGGDGRGMIISERTRMKRRKNVFTYSRTTGAYIGKYTSVKEAATKLNISTTTISSCLTGRLKFIKDFIFKSVYEGESVMPIQNRNEIQKFKIKLNKDQFSGNMTPEQIEDIARDLGFYDSGNIKQL